MSVTLTFGGIHFDDAGRYFSISANWYRVLFSVLLNSPWSQDVHSSSSAIIPHFAVTLCLFTLISTKSFVHYFLRVFAPCCFPRVIFPHRGVFPKISRELLCSTWFSCFSSLISLSRCPCIDILGLFSMCFRNGEIMRIVHSERIFRNQQIRMISPT